MNTKITRHIFLDIETTGINQIGIPYKGHKIIEIGAVEAINRRLTGNNFHTYLNPSRLVDPEAFSIHGISNEFLLNKPKFSEIVDNFFQYIRDSELIVHNSSFDINFINYESSKLDFFMPKINTLCKITDTLSLARKMFPGKRNSLNSLCSRFKIDKSQRILHGALLDAKILASVYLAMTSHQVIIPFSQEEVNYYRNIKPQLTPKRKLRVLLANRQELIEHISYVNSIKQPVW